MTLLVLSLDMSSSFNTEERSTIGRHRRYQKDTQVLYIPDLHISRKVMSDEREQTPEMRFDFSLNFIPYS